MEKVMPDVGCSLEVALAWCILAKNSLLNFYGYSPNQLVFGYNPNDTIASKCINSARKRFIESEADEKLRRALRHKTRLSTSKVFQSGDQVFYKRSDSGCWKGPGTVIWHDNKQVFVRHGGIYVRVSPCHLQLVSESEKTENVGTNEVESHFKKGTEIAESEEKGEISCNRNIDHF